MSFDVNSQGTDPDGTGHWPATMEADFLLPPNKQAMNQWGICLPLWKGSTSPEPWQIQPIETLGQSNPQWFPDEDDYMNNPVGYRTIFLVSIPNWTGAPVYMEGADVQRAQRAFGSPDNGIFNEACQIACKAFQTKNGLTADGSCGPLTWTKINDTIGPYIDWEAKYNECKTQLDEANKTIALRDIQISQLTAQNKSLTTQNQNLTATNAALTTQNQNLTTENTSLKSQNAVLVQENADLTKENQELTAENRELRDAYAALDNKYDELFDIVTKYNKAKVDYDAAAQDIANIGVG
jgi:FtsZ-binding cell division protein ZapB